LYYETASVTVKNGQYLDQPADPKQVAHILTNKIHVHLLIVKITHIIFNTTAEMVQKLTYFVESKTVVMQDNTNPVLNTEVQTSKK
jgi:hypothetical protein